MLVETHDPNMVQSVNRVIVLRASRIVKRL